jgi:multidrug efflux pump subunit AcrA (membrane-fusion protein)
VATQQGGIVRWVLRQPGGQVAGGEQLGRILGPTGEVEVLSAPYAATLLDVPVQLGDTLLPGALVALIGDLSELRVQTTDVDEYLIASISVGLPVEISVDALPGRMFGGRVEMVSPGAEAGTGSRLQYPVVITVDNGDPALRPGMTAHLRFKAQTRGQ